MKYINSWELSPFYCRTKVAGEEAWLAGELIVSNAWITRPLAGLSGEVTESGDWFPWRVTTGLAEGVIISGVQLAWAVAGLE